MVSSAGTLAEKKKKKNEQRRKLFKTLKKR